MLSELGLIYYALVCIVCQCVLLHSRDCIVLGCTTTSAITIYSRVTVRYSNLV